VAVLYSAHEEIKLPVKEKEEDKERISEKY